MSNYNKHGPCTTLNGICFINIFYCWWVEKFLNYVYLLCIIYYFSSKGLFVYFILGGAKYVYIPCASVQVPMGPEESARFPGIWVVRLQMWLMVVEAESSGRWESSLNCRVFSPSFYTSFNRYMFIKWLFGFPRCLLCHPKIMTNVSVFKLNFL